MIHHGKCHELEITDFDYQHDRTPPVVTIPSQTSNPQIFRDYKRSNCY